MQETEAKITKRGSGHNECIKAHEEVGNTHIHDRWIPYSYKGGEP